MTWKDEFYSAVLYALTERWDVKDAVEVTDVYDAAETYENSLGYADLEYSVDITYKDVDGRSRLYTYTGRFASLIEDLT